MNADDRLPEKRATEKMGLAVRLRLGAALALLLVLVATAAAWWIAMEYEDDVAVEHRSQLLGASQLAEAESALWQLRYGVSQFMTGDAETKKHILDEDPKWHAVIEGALSGYGAAPRRSVEEQEALAQLRAEYERYRAARPRFFELWQDGRRQEAIDLRALTVTPYGAATVRAFGHQIALQRDIAGRAQAEAEIRVDRARKLVLAIGGILSALVVLGYAMAMRQLRPVVDLRTRVSRTAQTLLGSELDVVDTGNEVDTLVDTVDAMTARFIEHANALAFSQEELRHERLALEEKVVQRTEDLSLALKHMERQNRIIAMRNEMGDLLYSCLGMGEAGAVIARFVPLLLPGASGAIYLHVDPGDTLVAVTHWGERQTPESLEVSDCWALRRGKPYTASGEDALLCPHVVAPLAGSALCVPLAAHGESLGLMHLACVGAAPCETGGIAPAEREQIAVALATQIGMALANLRLRETLREQSVRDTLTGLFNRRYLEESLDRELARAVREKGALAVFMLDVDHFKKFNDNHGHEAGDAVLRALGRALRDNARDSDLPCRFGGEEFTVVLPGTPPEAARAWGERLMERVRYMEVRASGQTLPKITISLGLAMCPQHGDDRETLLQAADLALYDAKHAGRDRLVVSGEISS